MNRSSLGTVLGASCAWLRQVGLHGRSRFSLAEFPCDSRWLAPRTPSVARCSKDNPDPIGRLDQRKQGSFHDRQFKSYDWPFRGSRESVGLDMLNLHGMCDVVSSAETAERGL